MTDLTPREVIERARRARQQRSGWESHWQECYDFVLPYRDTFGSAQSPGAKRTDKLFDGTAPDAVDQLAASLLAQLTPPWAQWFGFAAGPDVDAARRDVMAADLEAAGRVLKTHLDRSNFAVEIHQCYLDLVVAGTASLLVEEAPIGEASALRFAAVPLAQVAFEEGPTGRLDITFRECSLRPVDIAVRFPGAVLPADIQRRAASDPDLELAVVEMVIAEGNGYHYRALLDGEGGMGEPLVLAEGRFAAAPYVNFRWLKAPGEVYGRSPVMKALPDIKTANKVVELVLKNASIAVTGIWQADDDGVLNPATIKLAPGTIIPKAVGSAGLTPLTAPGKFDVSQLMLDDLRGRIRQALLVDKLGPVDSPRMTATEVMERAADMARILGATYGRLQSELLNPLIARALAILARRGEVRTFAVDGRTIELQHRSPLAQHQSRVDAQNAVQWIQTVAGLGPAAASAVDLDAAARWLARTYGVPEEIVKPPAPTAVPIAPGVAANPMEARHDQ